MSKSKIIKIFMITVGGIIAALLIAFMILNHYIFDLDLIYVFGVCVLIIIFWVIVNYIGIKIILSKR